MKTFFTGSVIPLDIPPLRSRRDDILPLLSHFAGPDYHRISEKDKELLCDYTWPGNVRELENSVICFKTLGFFPVLNTPLPGTGTSGRSVLNGYNTVSDANNRGHIVNTKERTEHILLDLLYSRSSAYHSTGRPEMLHFLRENGVLISDGRLRELLSEMENDGLIRIERGRRGTSITEKGIMALDAPDNSEDKKHQ